MTSEEEVIPNFIKVSAQLLLSRKVRVMGVIQLKLR